MIDNLTQIEMGRIAQEKSQNEQVKPLGQTLVTDHQNAQDKLQNIAQQYNVTLPPYSTAAQKLQRWIGKRWSFNSYDRPSLR